MEEFKCRGYAGDVPVYCAHDKIVPVVEVKPNPKNPNHHPEEQIELLAKIIKTQGWRAPVTVSTLSGMVVRGHGRLMAAKFLGLEFVPVDFQHYKSNDAELADLLADNKIAELAEIDRKMLVDVFKDIDPDAIDIDITGYNEEEYKSITAALTEAVTEPELKDPDAPVEPPKKSITLRGDVWKIGRHRLICGDSTDSRTVFALLDGKKADLVFTDPPYGMKKEADGVANDNLNYDDLLEFNKRWIPLTFDALKENGSWYCWGIDEPLMDIYSHILKPMIKAKRICFRNLITWDKGNGQGQLSADFRMYPVADEKCLFVMVGGDSVQTFCVNADDYNYSMDAVRVYLETEIKKIGQNDKMIANALGWKDGRTVNHWYSKSQFALPTRENYEALRSYGMKVLNDTHFLKREYDELKREYDEQKKNFYEGRSYFDNTHDNMNNVWHFDRTGSDERNQTGGHATPKPVALCCRAIKSSSREGEVVLDIFGGSGSTLIACEKLNRSARLIELEPKWCDTIVKRYTKVTGKTDVILLRDGKEIPVEKTGILD